MIKQADSMTYDPKEKKMYVAAGGEEAELAYSVICVVSTADNTHLSDIRIDSKNIEAIKVDPDSGRLFANIRDQGKLGVVDLKAGALAASWPLPIKGNTPMILDLADHRIYVVGRKPGKFVALDSETGKVIATAECVDGADELCFDAQHHRLYVTGVDGSISVIEKRSADEFKTVATIPSGFLGKNSFYAPELGLFYVAVSEDKGKPAELRVYRVN